MTRQQLMKVRLIENTNTKSTFDQNIILVGVPISQLVLLPRDFKEVGILRTLLIYTDDNKHKFNATRFL